MCLVVVVLFLRWSILSVDDFLIGPLHLFFRCFLAHGYFFLCYEMDSNNRMAIASDKMVFYYMARDNLCFLTLCEEAYPKRMAFLYLDEIADLILQEMLQEYGANVRYVMLD